jgi:hypothetical protein
MKYTNTQNLLKPLVEAIKNDPYSGKGFTASMLPQPVQIYALKKMYDDKITIDVSDMLYPLLGNNTHYIVQRMGISNALQEERLYASVNGHEVSCQIDLYMDRILQDFKVTTRWVLIDGAKDEWVKQQNINSFIVESNGFGVDKIEVVCIFRDWSKIQAIKNPDYPKYQVAVLPVEKWSLSEQMLYILERINLFKDAEKLPDTQLPECTSVERWEKPTIYAVMKKGRKSSVRNLTSRLQAEDFIIDKHLDTKTHSIEVRPGESMRCEYYCEVKDFCHQYKKMMEQTYEKWIAVHAKED